MKKDEIVKNLVNVLKVESVVIAKIYGVTCGIGYDLDIKVSNTLTGEVKFIKAHASNKSWDCLEWLHPNRAFNTYKGGNNPYRFVDSVTRYWMDGCALENYYMRYNKASLVNRIIPSWGRLV